MSEVVGWVEQVSDTKCGGLGACPLELFEKYAEGSLKIVHVL